MCGGREVLKKKESKETRQQHDQKPRVTMVTGPQVIQTTKLSNTNFKKNVS